MENFREVHIVVAKFLHLEEKGKLWSSLLTERNEQLRIGLQNKKGEQTLSVLLKSARAQMILTVNFYAKYKPINFW